MHTAPSMPFFMRRDSHRRQDARAREAATLARGTKSRRPRSSLLPSPKVRSARRLGVRSGQLEEVAAGGRGRGEGGEAEGATHSAIKATVRRGRVVFASKKRAAAAAAGWGAGEHTPRCRCRAAGCPRAVYEQLWRAWGRCALALAARARGWELRLVRALSVAFFSADPPACRCRRPPRSPPSSSRSTTRSSRTPRRP